MRDKLIELIDSNKACDFEWDCNECKYYDKTPCFGERLADVLIANGVTFAEDNNVPCKWIPVGERLPDKSGKYLVRCELWGWGKLFNQWTGLCFFWDETRQFIDDGGPVMGKVTHWMPLPEPPKEGE